METRSAADLAQVVDAQLARRLVEEGPTSEATHMALAILVGFLTWAAGERMLATIWSGSVIAAVIVRAGLRLWGARQSQAMTARRAVRIGVFLVGLAWGTGAMVAWPHFAFSQHSACAA